MPPPVVCVHVVYVSVRWVLTVFDTFAMCWVLAMFDMFAVRWVLAVFDTFLCVGCWPCSIRCCALGAGRVRYVSVRWVLAVFDTFVIAR